MAGIEKVPSPRSGAHTVIGSSIVIDGEISGDEDLVIQGTVKGRISLRESLFVEGSGVIEADIETANVEVSGQVTGNIAASDKVELKADCKVVGDIRAPRILIAARAGHVDRLATLHVQSGTARVERDPIGQLVVPVFRQCR
jgi:cytoskeletal protein CcmA (bactofilin family)